MKGFAASLIFLAASAASAQGMHQVTTGPRAMGCQSQGDYMDLVATGRAGDKASFQRIFLSGRCVILPYDEIITVIDGPEGEHGLMLTIFEGDRLWVPQERLNYGVGGPPR
jgi:hypothetical protein